MLHKIARWLMFFPMRALDLLTITLMALYTPYFWFKVRGRFGQPLTLNPNQKISDIIEKGKLDPYDQYNIVRNESHCLLQQSGSGLLRPELRDKLIEEVIYSNDTLYRKFPEDETWLGPSGDALSSWVFAYTLWDMKRPDLVKRVATAYLKNCFGLWWNTGNGVSARSSNGGVSVVVDGWPKGEKWWPFNWGLMQPVTGPGYFSSAGIFALAAKELGGLWHLVYFLHWLLLGGWFFNLVPILYTKNMQWYYTHHITAMNLWSLNKLRGGFKHALRWVSEYVAPSGNAQPTIVGFAADAGASSSNMRSKAIMTLASVKGAHFWPQNAPLDQGFFEGDPKLYSMAALAAILLTRNYKDE